MIVGNQIAHLWVFNSESVEIEPNGTVRVCLIPFVHSQSYRPIKVHLAPNYHLAGSPLELSQVPLGVPGPQFGNHWSTQCSTIHTLYIFYLLYLQVLLSISYGSSVHFVKVKFLHFGAELFNVMLQRHFSLAPFKRKPIEQFK